MRGQLRRGAKLILQNEVKIRILRLARRIYKSTKLQANTHESRHFNIVVSIIIAQLSHAYFHSHVSMSESVNSSLALNLDFGYKRYMVGYKFRWLFCIDRFKLREEKQNIRTKRKLLDFWI